MMIFTGWCYKGFNDKNVNTKLKHGVNGLKIVVSDFWKSKIPQAVDVQLANVHLYEHSYRLP
jgi:hypothetical protein